MEHINYNQGCIIDMSEWYGDDVQYELTKSTGLIMYWLIYCCMVHIIVAVAVDIFLDKVIITINIIVEIRMMMVAVSIMEIVAVITDMISISIQILVIIDVVDLLLLIQIWMTVVFN